MTPVTTTKGETILIPENWKNYAVRKLNQGGETLTVPDEKGKKHLINLILNFDKKAKR